MSTGRVLWIIFCCVWAAFWMLGVVSGNVWEVALVSGSLLAILIPIGKSTKRSLT